MAGEPETCSQIICVPVLTLASGEQEASPSLSFRFCKRGKATPMGGQVLGSHGTMCVMCEPVSGT